jgi:hypothetical protein
MSNDLILSIKSSLAKVGVDAETLAVAGKSGGGGGGGSKRISIKGGVFRNRRPSHERDLREDGS